MSERFDTSAERAQAFMLCGIFDGIDDASLEALVKYSHTKILDRGETLYAQGDTDEALYMVRSGGVELSRRFGNSDKVIATRLVGPNDYCGEVELFAEAFDQEEPATRWLSARAIDTTAVVIIELRHLQLVFQRNPICLSRLHARLSATVRDLIEELEELAFRPAESRLAAHILDLAEVLGVRTGDAIRIRQRFPHQMLAEAIGVSRRSVIGCISHFEEFGILHQSRRSQITILDPARLNEIAERETDIAPDDVLDRMLTRLDRLLAGGLNAKAAQMASQYLKDFPKNRDMAYRAVLATARSGASHRALDLFRQYEVGKIGDSEDVLCLEPRLLKDLAASRPDSRERLEALTESADKYDAVFRETGGYYSGVNAATVNFLAGNEKKSKELAIAVLRTIPKSDISFFAHASRAEAALLLGEYELARGALAGANTATDKSIAMVGTTRRQLTVILDQTKDAEAFSLEEYLPQGKVIHYVGHMWPTTVDLRDRAAEIQNELRAEIDDVIAAQNIVVGVGSLASGADILIAESLIDAGCELRVVLPFQEPDFMKYSILPSGKEWQARYEHCLAAAQSVHFFTQVPFNGDDKIFDYAARYAMGLVVMRALELGAEYEQLAVWNESDGRRETGTDGDMMAWAELGGSTHIIDCPWPIRPGRTRENDIATPKTGCKFVLLLQAPQSTANKSELPTKAGFDAMMKILNKTAGSLDGQVSADQTDTTKTVIIFNNATRCLDAGRVLHKAFDEAGISIQLLGDYGPIAIDATDAGEQQINLHQLALGSCHPEVDTGGVYVTETFVSELCIEKGQDTLFEPIGRVPTLEKSIPIPLFGVFQS